MVSSANRKYRQCYDSMKELWNVRGSFHIVTLVWWAVPGCYRGPCLGIQTDQRAIAHLWLITMVGEKEHVSKHILLPEICPLGINEGLNLLLAQMLKLHDHDQDWIQWARKIFILCLRAMYGNNSIPGYSNMKENTRVLTIKSCLLFCKPHQNVSMCIFHCGGTFGHLSHGPHWSD